MTCITASIYFYAGETRNSILRTDALPDLVPVCCRVVIGCFHLDCYTLPPRVAMSGYASLQCMTGLDSTLWRNDLVIFFKNIFFISKWLFNNFEYFFEKFSFEKKIVKISSDLKFFHLCLPKWFKITFVFILDMDPLDLHGLT